MLCIKVELVGNHIVPLCHYGVGNACRISTLLHRSFGSPEPTLEWLIIFNLQCLGVEVAVVQLDAVGVGGYCY
jgi:hypothetical protein